MGQSRGPCPYQILKPPISACRLLQTIVEETNTEMVWMAKIKQFLFTYANLSQFNQFYLQIRASNVRVIEICSETQNAK